MKKRKSNIINTTESDRSQGKLEDSIRQRAHQIYEQRGKENGHDVEDWLTAEVEVTARSNGE